jgi:endonuclease/exonuclease/phosphatase (EEP) superfamily protein YafD
VAWLVVLPWAAWVTVRVLGLDRWWPVVGVVAFTAWASAGALAGTIVAVALRQRVAAAVGAVSLIVLVALVAPRAIGNGDERLPGERPLRVLTLNILHEGARADAVVQLVERKRPDILLLQEYTPLAASALHDEGLRRVLPNAVLSRPGTEAGETAIYTRLPVRRVAASGRRWTAAVVRAPGGRAVEVHAVHPPPPVTRDAMRVWRDELRSLPGAESARLRLLGGDFNATLDHRELRSVLGRGYVDAAEQAGAGLRTTWPVGRRIPPTITIDHVLADERMRVGDVTVHTVVGTDHRAVFAELFVPGA